VARIGYSRFVSLAFGVERPTDLSVVDDGQLAWMVIEPLYEVVDLAAPSNAVREILDQSTAGQRALLAIHWFMGEVTNGGLLQFFENSAGCLSGDVLAGLDLTGAGGYPRVLRQALDRLPDGAATKEWVERQSLVEALDEDAFDDLDDEFFALNGPPPAGVPYPLERSSAAYVRAHPEEFFA
jgi:hypothetical protein